MTRKPSLSVRDRALIAEVIGYLRGIAAGYNDDDKQHDWPRVLAARLENMRLKVWPVDPPRRS